MNVRDLFDLFDRWNQANRAPRTRQFYRECLGCLLELHGDLLATDLRPYHLQGFKPTWHRVMAVQRLYAWAVVSGVLADNPFRKMARPRRGCRRRVLGRRDLLLLLRQAKADFRNIILAGRETAARPQELRTIDWTQIEIPDGQRWAESLRAGDASIVLTEFKGRARRSDPNSLRVIPISPRLGRLLLRIGRGRRGEGVIFRTCKGFPWHANNMRCRMRRLRSQAPIELFQRGERVVMYTLRHSAATSFAARGLPHAVLQELLGHTTPRMMQQYLHLGRQHVLDAWRRFHSPPKG